MNSSSSFAIVEILPVEEYSLETKVCVGLLAPILVSLVLFLNFGIAYYEKFGHDPQKRNLSNMTISSFCLGLGATHIFLALFGSIRIIFGPFDVSNTFAFVVVLQILAIFKMFCLLEFGIYRLLAVYFPKAIISINDDFFHCFFNCCNLMMACIVSLTSNWNTTPLALLENLGHPIVTFVSFFGGQEQHNNYEK